jgi:integration host factor subunit beta
MPSNSPRSRELCGPEGTRLNRQGTMTKQPTLTKADLIEEVLKVAELPRKESETIVETIFESIIDALQKGDKIEIRGFGSFRTRQRRGRIGRNPKTGEKVEVPAKKIPFFKPSKELKDFVNTSATAIGEAAQ